MSGRKAVAKTRVMMQVYLETICVFVLLPNSAARYLEVGIESGRTKSSISTVGDCPSGKRLAGNKGI